MKGRLQKMKFTADKKMLERSIAPVCLGVAPKNTDPLLEGIYLEAGGGVLTMCSYDREKGIRTTLEADIEKEGKIVADAQKTAAIIHSLPDGPVTIESDENLIIKIITDEADFQISGKDASNYPGLPDVRGDLSYTLQQNKIRSMINKTLFAVSQDDSKPIYTGSLFEINGNSMRITALDGFRVSMRSEEGLTERDDLDLRFIMPGKAQNDLFENFLPDERRSYFSLPPHAASFIILLASSIKSLSVLILHIPRRVFNTKYASSKRSLPVSFNIIILFEHPFIIFTVLFSSFLFFGCFFSFWHYFPRF